MFFPAEADAEDDDDKAEQEYGEIAIFPIQLRHIFEIHAVPACNERQGEKDGGDDGEDFHDFILPDVDLGLVNLPDLRMSASSCSLPTRSLKRRKAFSSLRLKKP